MHWTSVLGVASTQAVCVLEHFAKGKVHFAGCLQQGQRWLLTAEVCKELFPLFSLSGAHVWPTKSIPINRAPFCPKEYLLRKFFVASSFNSISEYWSKDAWIGTCRAQTQG